MILSPASRLSVGTLLPTELQERVHQAVVPPGEIFSAHDSHELFDWASAVWSDAAVVDPERGHLTDGSDIRDWPGVVPVIVYLQLRHSAARSAVILARTVAFDLVVFGFGDDPRSLRSRLVGARGAALGRSLYCLIEPALESLPERVRSGIETFCVSARAVDSVSAMAAQCAVGRGSLWRLLSERGINAQRLVTGARLVRGYPLLERRDLTAAAVARALKLGSAQTLERQLAAVAGQSLAALRIARSFPSFVGRVAAALRGEDPTR